MKVSLLLGTAAALCTATAVALFLKFVYVTGGL
jgi:hypothetical protein